MAFDCQVTHYRLIRDTFWIGRFCFRFTLINSGQKKATQTSGSKGSLFKIRTRSSPLDKITVSAKTAFGALFARLLWSVAN